MYLYCNDVCISVIILDALIVVANTKSVSRVSKNSVLYRTYAIYKAARFVCV